MRENVDEKLAWLCHLEVEGGPESAAAEIRDMSRDELERVLLCAVSEVLDANERAEREIARFARRMNQKRGS